MQADFVERYLGNGLEETLDVMDAFNRLTPLSTKVGEMVFLCTCANAYQKYTCVEAIVLSLLFNPNLNVPDTERAKQFKERVKVACPLNTKLFKDLKAQQAANDDTEAPNWRPEVCTFKDAHEGNAVAMVMQRLASPAAKFINTPGHAAPVVDPLNDPLQRPVDPKLLLPSRGKGPAKDRFRRRLRTDC